MYAVHTYVYIYIYNGKIFHRICTKMKKCSHSKIVCWDEVGGRARWVGIMIMEQRQQKADRSRKMKLSAYGNETQIFCVCVCAGLCECVCVCRRNIWVAFSWSQTKIEWNPWPNILRSFYVFPFAKIMRSKPQSIRCVHWKRGKRLVNKWITITILFPIVKKIITFGLTINIYCLWKINHVPYHSENSVSGLKT